MRKSLFLFVLVALLAASAWPQTVVQRTRLGHVVEDLDAVDKRLAALDGQEVYIADASSKRFEKLFDVRSGGADHSTGFTYVPTEKVFLVLSPPAHLSEFFVFDEKGAPLGTRSITYMAGFSPVHVEALTYLDKGTPYPDHVAFLAYQPFGEPYLEVARRDGTVVVHVPLGGPFVDATFGMASAGGDRLYVIASSNNIYTVDFSGQIVVGPVRVHEDYHFEGVTKVGDRVYLRDYFSGKFLAFDTNLQRQPADDLRHEFGIGLGGLLATTWNSDSDRHIVHTASTRDIALSTNAWEVVSSLDDARLAFFPRGNGFQRARGMSWMPDEHKVAVAHPQPQRRILIYAPTGELLEQIDVTPIGRPTGVAWIPSTQQFYVRTVEMPTTLRVLTRAGAFVRDIDLSALDTAVGPFTHVAGQLLLFAGGLLYRTDLDGVVLASYDPAPLNVIPSSISAITTGPLAGKYAVTAARNCEFVVFSLP